MPVGTVVVLLLLRRSPPPPSPSLLIDTRRAVNFVRPAGGGPTKTAYDIDFPTTVAEVRVLGGAPATPAAATRT